MFKCCSYSFNVRERKQEGGRERDGGEGGCRGIGINREVGEE